MHILLRPVPGLSVNPWKDAKPLPSSLPQNAPTWTALYRSEHRLPSPRSKLAPRGTRKNAPHATRGRLARLAAEPAVTGAGSTRAPHRSLSAAVVASQSLCRSREPPSRRNLQSAARDDPSRRSLSGSPSARRPLPDRLARAARSPDLSPARNHPITGWGCRGPGTPDQKAGWTAFRLAFLRAPLHAAEAFVPGGRNAEHSAHPVIPPEWRNAVSRMRCRRSPSGRRTGRTRRRAVVEESKSPLLSSTVTRYHLRLHSSTSEDMSLTCKPPCQMMTAATGLYRRIRASTEQAPNRIGLGH